MQRRAWWHAPRPGASGLPRAAQCQRPHASRAVAAASGARLAAKCASIGIPTSLDMTEAVLDAAPARGAASYWAHSRPKRSPRQRKCRRIRKRASETPVADLCALRGRYTAAAISYKKPPRQSRVEKERHERRWRRSQQASSYFKRPDFIESRGQIFIAF